MSSATDGFIDFFQNLEKLLETSAYKMFCIIHNMVCLLESSVTSWNYFIFTITAQKMKFFTKDFFSKCDQIRSFLRIWSHLLKKSLVENFISCAVYSTPYADQ